jgi:hypothetical protein
MLSLQYIQQISDEKAAEAAVENKEPYIYFDNEEVDRLDSFPFPHLGDYIPEGWRQYGGEGGLFFVDGTGFGEASEPALTGDQFKSEVKKILAVNALCGWEIGWAIVEAGQFQVYIQAFKKEV